MRRFLHDGADHNRPGPEEQNPPLSAVSILSAVRLTVPVQTLSGTSMLRAIGERQKIREARQNGAARK